MDMIMLMLFYRQFLEMVRMGSRKKKAAKKNNEYLENFKKIVKKEQEALKTFLEEVDTAR